MIVNRRVWGIKSGRVQDAVALLRKENAAERERGGYAGPIRMYISTSDEFDQIAAEYEYADLAECKKLWALWASRPTTPAFVEAWHALRIGEETDEIWAIPD